MNEEEIVDYVNNMDSDSESDDDVPVSKIKLSEVKQHLNYVIDFVEQSDNKEISAYYNHMRHLHELIVKQMCEKPQVKINSFFKSIKRKD